MPIQQDRGWDSGREEHMKKDSRGFSLRGFSLIELLIVVAIILIIAAKIPSPVLLD